ncbi:MAG: hypothetical protein EPN91_13030 [Salinibacterium sp.]|nr:MAG: hypothetical protein EPN91_13030 [Salinibacterium sp.]
MPWFRAGQVLFYAVMGFLFCVMVIVRVLSALDSGEPTYWGTYTEKSCEPRPGLKGGCRSFGTWTSDDGTITKIEIALDGYPDQDGTIRASYRPKGFISDSDNNIVHAEQWSGAGVWAPWLGAAVIAVAIAERAMEWRGTWPRRKKS